MTELGIRLVLLLLWAAVVSLDERCLGSYVFHQPIVAGSVAGALMGNLTGGMTAGIVFQCLWPGLLPIGGVLLPAVGLAGVLGGAVAGWGAHLVGTQALWTADGPLLFGVVLGLLAAAAGGAWEQGTRARNAKREETALASTLPLGAALDRALRGAILDSAARGVVITGLGVMVAAVVYLWPAGVRRMGEAPWPQVGWGLRLAGLSLGVGALHLLFHGPRPRVSPAMLWGLAAGILAQLIRSLG